MANNYTTKQQLSNGIWVVPDGDQQWGGELNYNFEKLNSLLNTYTLTIKQNGVTVATFDRTEDITANIDTVYPTNDQVDILFPDYQGSPISSTTPNEKTEVNYSSLIRYTNDLKHYVIYDVSISNNTLTFSYLDNNTKDIQLPQGSTIPTKSVSRIPIYLKITFYITGNEPTKLNLSTTVVKDAVKVYKKVGDLIYPIDVLNVSETTSDQDYESTFLMQVNMTPKDFNGWDSSIFVAIGDSFANISVSDPEILDKLNTRRVNETPVEVITGQIVCSESSIIELLKEYPDEHNNVFELSATLTTDDFIDTYDVYNNGTVSFYKGVGAFSFHLSLDHASEERTTESFTVFDI